MRIPTLISITSEQFTYPPAFSHLTSCHYCSTSFQNTETVKNCHSFTPFLTEHRTRYETSTPFGHRTSRAIEWLGTLLGEIHGLAKALPAHAESVVQEGLHGRNSGGVLLVDILTGHYGIRRGLPANNLWGTVGELWIDHDGLGHTVEAAA